VLPLIPNLVQRNYFNQGIQWVSCTIISNNSKITRRNLTSLQMKVYHLTRTATSYSIHVHLVQYTSRSCRSCVNYWLSNICLK
jgi:hypothetical protein